MSLPASLARFNRGDQQVTRLIAPSLPGFGIVTHRGRRSGQTYETPGLELLLHARAAEASPPAS